jgi:hypothetical protein
LDRNKQTKANKKKEEKKRRKPKTKKKTKSKPPNDSLFPWLNPRTEDNRISGLKIAAWARSTEKFVFGGGFRSEKEQNQSQAEEILAQSPP